MSRRGNPDLLVSVARLTFASCDAIKDHMKTITVRDLRWHFPMVETPLAEREEILIAKHRRQGAQARFFCPLEGFIFAEKFLEVRKNMPMHD